MFFILGLPKSRTTWLSTFLYDSQHPTYHEKSIEFSSFDEMGDWCKRHKDSGIVDTALLQFYPQLLEITTQVVLIVRDPVEVEESLINDGFPEGTIDYLWPYYFSALTDPKIKKIDFTNLSDVNTVKDLCSFLEITFDEDKFSLFKESIVMTDINVFMDKFNKYTHDYSWLLDGISEMRTDKGSHTCH